jgi:hypothetical protein
MTAKETLDGLIGTFDKAFLTMSGVEWHALLDQASREERRRALRACETVQSTRLRLGNQKLTEISKKLVANEAELQAGIANVAKALKRLDDVASTLDAISSLLGALAKVISIV